MSPEPSKPSTDNSESQELSSFGGTKEKVLNMLWNWVPIKLRVPLVMIVILVGAAISTQSYWKPLIDAWFLTPPPQLTFGGYIYADENQPLQTEIRLMSVNNKEVKRMLSDSHGLVGFNVSGDAEIAAIECKTENGWKRFPVTTSQLKQPKKFYIMLSTETITYK